MSAPAITRRGLAALAMPGLATLAMPGLARAQQDWSPTRPVHLVVPFAPGGSTDILGRLVAEGLGARLGQPVVVENRAGASGLIAVEYVSHAAPDGYTIVMGTGTTHAASLALYKSLPYHPQRDFTPVGLVAYAPNLLVVHPSVPARSVRELIDYAKAHPGQLNYGTAGNGTTQHLSAAMFCERAGVEMTHVPYRGGGPVLQDLVAGRVQLTFAPVVEVLQQVRNGELRALGLTIPRRMAVLPEVPAISEVIPDFELTGWIAFFAPARTPAAAAERISRETAAVVRTPAMLARLGDLGLEGAGTTPAELAEFQAAEIPRWARLVQISGTQPQ